MQDYRRSHLMPCKGESYHRAFVENPYRAVIWNLEQRVLRRVLASRLAGRAIRLLDFACGTGRIVGFLEDKVAEAVGIDISESMLEVARQQVRGATLLNADLTSDDVLGGRTFNLVTAFRFFPNAEPDLRRQAIGILRKHLEPGGYLVFNNHLNRGSLRDRLSRWVNSGNRVHRMGADEVADLVATARLRVVQKYHLGLLPLDEDRPWLPRRLLEPVEAVFMAVNSEVLCRMSQHVIYVCGDGASEGGSSQASQA